MTWEAIAGFSSAVVAFCALGLTVWQAFITRRHNKLSVRPHLTTWIRSDRTNHLYQIDLLNNGIGPAFILSFQICVDGHAIVGERSEPIEKALRVLFSQYQFTSDQSFVGPGYSMAAKESRTLVAVQFHGDSLPKSEEVDHCIKRARLRIVYSSIYDERFELDSDALRADPPLPGVAKNLRFSVPSAVSPLRRPLN